MLDIQHLNKRSMVHFAAKEQESIKTHQIITRIVDGDGLILADFFDKKETEIRPKPL